MMGAVCQDHGDWPGKWQRLMVQLVGELRHGMGGSLEEPDWRARDLSSRAEDGLSLPGRSRLASRQPVKASSACRTKHREKRCVQTHSVLNQHQ